MAVSCLFEDLPLMLCKLSRGPIVNESEWLGFIDSLILKNVLGSRVQSRLMLVQLLGRELRMLLVHVAAVLVATVC